MIDLKILKAGDYVKISHRFNLPEVAKITKTTPTQIIVGDRRFYKKDGGLIGGGTRWFRSHIITDDAGTISEKEMQACDELIAGRLQWTARVIHAEKVIQEAAAGIAALLGLTDKEILVSTNFSDSTYEVKIGTKLTEEQLLAISKIERKP